MRICFSNTNYQKRVEYTSLISVVPPLDIAYCAALVREKITDSEISIIDANVLGLSDSEHLAAIRKFDPEVLVFTSATYTINSVKQICRHLADHPSFKILIGTHGSALPEQTLAWVESLDAIVRGEPEWGVLNVVQSLKELESISGIEGINFRDNGEIRSTPDRSWHQDMDSLPFPARDLIPNEAYSSPYSQNVTALRTTRGCPGRCTFCDSHLLFGSRTRMRRPESVVAEIRLCVDKYRTDYFAIIDHTFTADRSFVTEVCDLIIKENLHKKIRWVCNTRVDMLDDEILAKMKEAGCLQVGIGIESADNKRLAATGKQIDEDQIRRAIIRIKKHGIVAMGYAIIGFPEDSKDSISQTKKKIFDFDPHTLQLSFATPLPGTGLYKKAVREERILSENWDDYVFLRKSILKNDTLTTEELVELRRSIVSDFYFRPRKVIQVLYQLFIRNRVSYISVLKAIMTITRNIGK